MSIYLPIKKLVYKELQPMAQAAGCQMILLDSKTYNPYDNKLEQKMKVLGIESDQYRELIDEINDCGCIAVLKSKRDYGPIEIAKFFARVGLEERDVHTLTSVNAKHYKIWGDFDASIPKNKVKFFYWFKVEVKNEDDEVVMESQLNERKLSRSELNGFYKALEQGELEFDFMKKDGTRRHARGTLDPKLMPSEQEIRQHYLDMGEDYDALMAKLLARKDYMPYYWDLDKGGYRQFHVSRFEGSSKPLI